MGINKYLTDSIEQVYTEIGERGMSYYYVPVIEKKIKDSMDYINYDFDNKIKIGAAINSDLTSDVDVEFAKLYLKNTRSTVTIQFTLASIAPYKVDVLDRIYVEYDDGRFENYLIVGIDNGVLLNGIYTSVRAFEFDGTLTNFQWADNGVVKNEVWWS